MPVDAPFISEGYSVELAEKIPLNDLQLLLRHVREILRADRLVECQFGRDYPFDIATEGILIPLRENGKCATTSRLC
jgi:hypothetical protein